MARGVETVRLSEAEQRQVIELQEWLYDQQAGPLTRPVTGSEAIRWAIRQAHAQGPGANKNKSRKS